jgi:GNAT superfamily N-acetyltransferase
MTKDVRIARYPDVARAAELSAALDEIFFQSSNTRSFANDAARDAFRERWLGRYLRHDPQFAYLALTASGQLAGYLVGSIDDPARSSRFADIGYFAHFRELTRRYPAHLHVNIATIFRNKGIGRRLIAAFIADARAAGAPGVHVVTSAGAKNVRFYNRNGFAEAGRLGTENALVFLARSIA